MATTLEERPNPLALDYIYNLNDDELIDLIYTDEHIHECNFKDGKKSTSIKSRKEMLSMLKKYIIDCHDDNFKKKTNYKQKPQNCRWIADGVAVQSLKGSIRGLFFRNNTFDIDQSNSQIVILLYIIKKYIPNTQHFVLQELVTNREKYLNQFMEKGLSRSLAKNLFIREMFLSSTNVQAHIKPFVTNFYKSYRNEMRIIQGELMELEQYNMFLPKTGSSSNPIGFFMSRLLQHYEMKVNSVMIDYLQRKGYEIASHMHDGALVYEPDSSVSTYDNHELLTKIEREVESKFPGLGMKWTYKEHNMDLQIPEDYEEKGINGGYNSIKKAWEKLGFCKINDMACFMQINDDGSTRRYTRTDIKTRGENFMHEKFIDAWLKDPNIKSYNTIGSYPPDQICPPNVFNTWIPFAGELMDYQEDIEGMNTLLKHFEILCDDEKIYNHFVKWVAYIIQKPSRKIGAVMPIFIGLEEGGGKGRMVEIIRRMLGDKKVMETTAPSKHVFGSFNSQLEHAYLVYLNEMSKKEMSGMEEHLKGYLTDSKITINEKYIREIQIDSYHKFICSTNNINPKTSTDNSRRDWYIIIPDTLVGDKEYFANLSKVIENDNAIGTLYNYLKNLDIEDFEKTPVPKCGYQEELELDSKKPIILWCEQYVKELVEQDGDFISLKENQELWDHYKKWMNDMNPAWTYMDRATFTRNLSLYVFKKMYGKDYRDHSAQVYKKSNGKTKFRFIKNDMCIHFNISTNLNP